MRYFNLAVLTILVLAFGCGYKYPLPPENPGALPNEEDYIEVRNTSWDIQTFSEIKDIIVGKDGYIYVLEEHALLKLNSNGDLVDTFYSGFVTAKSVAQDVRRNVYVTDSCFIYVFDRDKNLLIAIDFADTLKPHGIDVDSNKNIYITQPEIHKLIKLDSLGNFVEIIVSYGSGILSVNNPLGLFVNEKMGAVIVASAGNNWVEAISLTQPRVNIVHLGGTTHEGGDTAGVFNYPTDVWSDTLGNIYVLDYGNKRIQKFRETGEFVTEKRFENVPVSLATSKDGVYLYVAFSDKVLKMKKPELPQNPGGEK
ncbi:MAG: NHL repeat-containing protein [bacterium]|nr:NHL repeat-containing protein [bacterium]